MRQRAGTSSARRVKRDGALHVREAARFGLPSCCLFVLRAAMKLTPELIQSVPSQLNPIKERQLDLRGALCVRRFESLTRVLAYRLHHPCHRKSWYNQGPCVCYKYVALFHAENDMHLSL